MDLRESSVPAARPIQKICADTGAKVDIDDDGSVFISAVDSAAAYAAKKMVDDICFVPGSASCTRAKVVRILPIGAFVESPPAMTAWFTSPSWKTIAWRRWKTC